ncbi:MAG: hypothetical protein Q4C14_00085 [Bacillota bacterium]|nr:hypothetical protein [Bacillota bacterium]
MKKKLALFMAMVLVFSLFLSACNNDASEEKTPDDGNSSTVVSGDSSPDGSIQEEPAGDDSQKNSDTEKNDSNKDTGDSKNGNSSKDTQKTEDNKVPANSKPQGGDNSSSGDNSNPAPEPPPAQDNMNWPGNEYTKLVPKPSAGSVRKTDMQNGIFCILMTGAEMVDAKAYAGALINAGYTNDVTETIEDGLYLFGGGNSKGSFVVVSYQNGQFIIGIEP